MTKQEIYTRWFTPGWGVTLKPKEDNLDVTSENDTLFYAYVLMLLELNGQVDNFDTNEVFKLANSIEVSDRPGCYHRYAGQSDLYRANRAANVSNKDISPNSKDNLLGIMSLLKIAKLENKRQDMSKALFKSFGTFNNTDSFRLIFNPGTYTSFGFLLPGKLPKVLGMLCLPFFLANYFISMSRDNFSNHMLNLLELYMNRHVFFIGWMFSHYKKTIKKKYGSIAEMSKRHPSFLSNPINEEHPITALIRASEEKGLL